MAPDPAPLDVGSRRWRLSTGVDRNALYLMAGGVALLACFALLRALGNPDDSTGRSVNLATAVALFAVVPFIVAIYRAASDGFVELRATDLYVRVGFLVDTAIPYADVDLVGGPIPRPDPAMASHLPTDGMSSAWAAWNGRWKSPCAGACAWARPGCSPSCG